MFFRPCPLFFIHLLFILAAVCLLLSAAHFIASNLSLTSLYSQIHPVSSPFYKNLIILSLLMQVWLTYADTHTVIMTPL